MADETDEGPSSGRSDWAVAARLGPWLVLPQIAIRKARRYPDRVLAARIVWLSFVVLHVVLGLLLGLVVLGVGGTGEISIGLASASVALVGLGATVVRFRTAGRALDVGDARELYDGWYIRFLRESAVMSVILPWSAVAGIYAAAPTVYLGGILLAFVNLALMVPSDERLARDADAVRAEPGGADVDLVEVLRSGGTTGAPTRRPAVDPEGSPDRPPPSKRTGGGGGRPANKSKKKKR